MEQPIQQQPIAGAAPVAAPPIEKPFSLMVDKFTKQNVYDLLIGIAEGKSAIAFNSDDSKRMFIDIMTRNFKPQTGGGKSNNPSHIDPQTGRMVHWCRFKKMYMNEVDMVMSGGKSKGASRLASKHNYELGKQAGILKEEALVLFSNQDYANGAAKNAEAIAIEESRNRAETYADEFLAQYIPKPNEAEDISTPVEIPTPPPMQAAVAQAPVAPPMTGQAPVQQVQQPAHTPVYIGNDANGNPVYQ